MTVDLGDGYVAEVASDGRTRVRRGELVLEINGAWADVVGAAARRVQLLEERVLLLEDLLVCTIRTPDEFREIKRKLVADGARLVAALLADRSGR